MDKVRLKRQLEIANERWQFTPRQLDVLAHVAKGHSNGEIAEALDISERTVEVHLTAIFVRTKCKTRAELIVLVWGAASTST